MSDSMPLGNISTYVAKEWVDVESITRSKWQRETGQIQSILANIKTALSDVQSRRSKSGHAPTQNTIAGQIVHDPSDDIWYGDPDGAGADDNFHSRLQSYGISNATAGTGTFKAGGAINVDTSPPPSSARTIPANTLNLDNYYIRQILWDANNSAVSPLWGVTPSILMTHASVGGASCTIVETVIIRTTAGAQKWFSYARSSRDDIGVTSYAGTGIASEDETVVLGLDATVTGTEDVVIVGLNS